MSIERTDTASVGFFEALYAVVVGLGLALAAEQVIDLQHRGVPVRSQHLPLFLAFLDIAFALAHSSVRYLQLAYVQGEVGVLRRGRVLGDLVLGVGQFLLIIAMALLITRPATFAVVVIILLLGRPARDLLLQMGGRKTLEFDRVVRLIHIVTVAIVAVTLIAASLARGSVGIWIQRGGVLTASLVFGLGMYAFAFDFFFPRSSVT